MRGWCVQWPLKRKWQRWQLLAHWERRVLLALWWRLPLAWVLVRVVSIGRLLGVANGALARVDNDAVFHGGADQKPLVERCGELAGMAVRFWPMSLTCLPTSLSLCHLLRGRGIDVKLRIGVQRDDTLLDAHAWVEYAGEPVGAVTDTYHAIV